jgi:hypothetical protein
MAGGGDGEGRMPSYKATAKETVMLAASETMKHWLLRRTICALCPPPAVCESEKLKGGDS